MRAERAGPLRKRYSSTVHRLHGSAVLTLVDDGGGGHGSRFGINTGKTSTV